MPTRSTTAMAHTRTNLLLAFICVFFSCVFCGVTLRNVENIDSRSWESTLNENKFVFVYFQSNECLPCQHSDVQFESAADTLIGRMLPAIVDVSAEQAIAQKFDLYVEMLPLFKMFKDGKEYATFPAGATADSGNLVAWAERQLLPFPEDLGDEDDVLDLIAAQDFSVVAFFPDSSAKGISAFTKAAFEHKDDIRMGICTNKAVAKKYKAEKKGKVIGFINMGPGEQPEQIVYSGKLNKDDINAWILQISFPLVDELNARNFPRYVRRGLPLMWLFVDPNDNKSAGALQSVSKIVNDHRDKFSFVFLDGVQNPTQVRRMGCNPKKLPQLALDMLTKNEQYTYNDIFDEEDIRDWVLDYIDGKLKPTFRTGPPPSASEMHGYVTPVVGSTFDKLVMKSKQDVLLLLCVDTKDCALVEDLFETLAESFKRTKTLMFAALDHEHNDHTHPDIVVHHYPSLYLISGDERKATRYTKPVISDEKVVQFLDEVLTLSDDAKSSQREIMSKLREAKEAEANKKAKKAAKRQEL